MSFYKIILAGVFSQLMFCVGNNFSANKEGANHETLTKDEIKKALEEENRLLYRHMNEIAEKYVAKTTLFTGMWQAQVDKRQIESFGLREFKRQFNGM